MSHWPMATLLLALLASELQAANSVTIQSQSGQFIVEGRPVGGPAQASRRSALTNQIELDPAVLAISCEKIKYAFLEALNLRDHWQGRILLGIRPKSALGDEIIVQSVRFLDGWQYRLAMPEAVEPRRLIKTLVEVLLLELTQRRSVKPVELPLWLGEGLASLVQTSHPNSLTMEPYTAIVQDRRKRDPLYAVRQRLQQRPPLTLDELSWPSDEQQHNKTDEVFETCAYLFLYELLRLDQGQECLQEFLSFLPEHLNWQTAFLRAFTQHFPRMIDLDKWWSLVVVQVSGGEQSYTWSVEESWQKLEDTLSASVEVRLQTDDLPMNTRTSLQSVIQEWPLQRQWPILQTKLNQLIALRLRVAQELSGVVEDYRRTIQRYLEKQSGKSLGDSDAILPSSNDPLLVAETVKRLNQLDDRRTAMRDLLRTAISRQNSAEKSALDNPQ